MRNLLIALFLGAASVSVPSIADASDEKIVVSNQKFSVVEFKLDGKVRYRWTTKDGRTGHEPTAKAAKKAAKKALKG